MGTDWVAWHDAYGRPGSRLAERLIVVRRLLSDALDRTRPGPVRLLSACAGRGDDVLGVLPDHPRRGDVRAVLVELDPVNANTARQRVEEDSLSPAVSVLEGDAGNTSSYRDIVPADVLLFCGVFGNVRATDIARTILELPALAGPGARVLWTRGRKPDMDITPTIRRWFAHAGFEEEAFVGPRDMGFTVGMHRLERAPQTFVPDAALFRFRS